MIAVKTLRFRFAYRAALVLAAVLFLSGADVAGAQDEDREGLRDQLFEAVFNNDLDGVKLAVADGADFELPLRLGRSALDLAVDLGHFEIAHYLLALRQTRRTRLARSIVPQIQAPPPFVPAPTKPAPTEGSASAPPVFVAAPESQIFREQDVQPGGPPAPTKSTSPAKPAPVAETVAETPTPPAPEPQVAAAPEPAEPQVAAAPAPAPEESPPPTPKAPPAEEVVIALSPAQAPTPVRLEQEAEAAIPAQADDTRSGAVVAAVAPEASAPTEPRLVFADGMLIGAPFDEENLEEVKCVDKRSGTRICALFATWPNAVADFFDVSGFVYSGTRAIAGYGDGAVRRYYAQFSGAAFAAVAQYHVERFGPPSRRLKVPSRQQSGGEIENELLIWEREGAQPGTAVVLELRRYDDVRRSRAEEKFGAVQLYERGAAPMFSRMSALEVMKLR